MGATTKLTTMKILYGLSALIVLLIFSAASLTGPGNFFCSISTNAPGEGTCYSCHSDGGLYTGSIEISIDGDPAEIAPNTDYDISVTISASSGSPVNTGFQIVALEDESGTYNNSGTWIPGSGTEIFDPSNPTNTSSCTPNGRIYIENIAPQSMSGSSYTWDFTWTSPATSTGDITFYTGGLLCNGSGTGNDTYFSSSTSAIPFSAPLAGNIINIVDATCFDSDNGGAEASVTGGTTPYSYEWDNGETNAAASNLSRGYHEVTITDNNSQEFVLDVTIDSPDEITWNIVENDGTKCFGSNDGVVEIAAFGGVGGYSYNWSDGFSGPVNSNLSFGQYFVTIEDANFCIKELDVFVDQPTQIQFSIMDVNDVSCFGNQDGSIVLEAEGGTGNLSYDWDTGDIGSTLLDIVAGNYTVTVTDNNFCTISQDFEVMEPESMVIEESDKANASCEGVNNGSVVINASGGIGGYSYVWDNGETGNMPISLEGGNNTVTVTDMNNCSIIYDVEIEVDEELSLSLEEAVDVKCFGGMDGSINIEINTSGDVEYMWSNGMTTQNISGLVAGEYLVQASNAEGCTSNELEIEISQPEEIVVDDEIAHLACFGDMSGNISLQVTGGTGMKSITWESGENIFELTDISAGNYSATITDENNCNETYETEVTQPEELVIDNLTIQDVSCFGGEDGMITLDVLGGAGEYSILWSDGSTGESLLNVSAGSSYGVSISDENECTVIEDNLVIEEPQEIKVTSDVTNESEQGKNDGSISLEVTGGAAPYSYEWSNGGDMASIENLAPGEYSYTITDANDCEITDAIIINEGGCLLMAAHEVEGISCHGANDGIITLTLTNASEAVIIEWSNGENTESIDNLMSGDYSVTVEDGEGCIVEIKDINVIEPEEIVISAFEIINTTGTDEMDGSITISSVEGGIGTLQYKWFDESDNLIGEDSQVIDNLSSGIYKVIITDENLCTVEQEFEVDSVVSTDDEYFEDNVSVYPNPIMRAFVIENDSKAEIEFVEILDNTGRVLVKYYQQIKVGEQKLFDWTVDQRGFYLIKLEGENGITIYKRVVH